MRLGSRARRRYIRDDPAVQPALRTGARGVSPHRSERRVEECHSCGWCLVFKGKAPPEGKIMRVFVTGATGALGRHLVPGLVAAGHEVTATTRTPGKVAQLREAGAEPVVVDGLDREAVIAAVRAAAPEVIVHQMTALAGMRSLRRLDRVFAATNELRTRGTDNLLAAAARAGTRRVIAQGYAGAEPPLRVPAWLGRLLAGEFVVAQMTTSRGSSNQKARKAFGWEPRHASWREGFRAWVRG